MPFKFKCILKAIRSFYKLNRRVNTIMLFSGSVDFTEVIRHN
jgi:hypothetical protein